MKASSLKYKILAATFSILAIFIINTPLIAGQDGDRFPSSIIKVFPQPCVQHLNVDLNVFIPGEVTLQVYSFDGKLILQQTNFYPSAGRYIQKLDLGDLPFGPYLLLDHDGSRRDASQMIIVGP